MTTHVPVAPDAKPSGGVGSIGAYPARQCLFRAYLNAHPAFAGLPRDQTDDAAKARADAGLNFERAVFDRIRARSAVGEFTLVDLADVPDVPDVRFPNSGGEATWATRQAMRARTEVILGGTIRAQIRHLGSVMKDDRVRGAVGSRSNRKFSPVSVWLVGKPDLLLLDRSSGAYFPVDVKHHQAKKGSRTAAVARLGLLGEDLDFDVMPELHGFTSYRRGTDGFQLAHYVRILLEQRRGRLGRWRVRNGFESQAAVALRGGVIGSDCVELRDPDSAIEIVWHDVQPPPRPDCWGGVRQVGSDAQRSRLEEWRATPSVFREQGKALRHVIENHLRGLGSMDPGTPAEAVSWGRVGKAECVSCERRSLCRQLAGPDDPSFALTVGRPNQGGWAYLYQVGGGTLDALSNLDPTTHSDAYMDAAKNYNRRARTPAMEEVVRRAQMIRDGELLRKREIPRRSGQHVRPLTHAVPRGDVEIDFDIEWAEDGYVYQWGALVRRALPDGSWSGGDYNSLTRLCFDSLDADSAKALADEFFAELRRFVEAEQRSGRTVRIFHWTAPEETKSREALTLSEAQVADTIDDLLPGLRVDLKKWVEDGWWSAHGYSIKVVASACGYEWDVEDPGGALSMVKIQQYRTQAGDWQAAGEWMRAYNRSDCAAQSAIRDALAK